jgi:aconitate hydratase
VVGAERGGSLTTINARIDTPVEWEYYRHGGILPMVLRRLAGSAA